MCGRATPQRHATHRLQALLGLCPTPGASGVQHTVGRHETGWRCRWTETQPDPGTLAGKEATCNLERCSHKLPSGLVQTHLLLAHLSEALPPGPPVDQVGLVAQVERLATSWLLSSGLTSWLQKTASNLGVGHRTGALSWDGQAGGKILVHQISGEVRSLRTSEPPLQEAAPS